MQNERFGLETSVASNFDLNTSSQKIQKSIIDHEALAKQGDDALGSAFLSASPSVSAPLLELFDPRPSYLVCRSTSTLARLGL